jgi:hypothetical protein
MEHYLLRSFRPHTEYFSRISLAAAHVYQVSRVVRTRSGERVGCFELAVEGAANRKFPEFGQIGVKVIVVQKEVLEECRQVVKVERVPDQDGVVRHEILLSHPKLGTVLHLVEDATQVFKFKGLQSEITSYIPERKVKLSLDERKKWISNPTLPFTLTKSSDSILKFEDCRGSVVSLGRTGVHKGSDYSFQLCENKEQLFPTLLCACFLKKSKECAYEHIKRERKYAEEHINKIPKEKEICDYIVGFQLLPYKYIIENLCSCTDMLLKKLNQTSHYYGRKQTIEMMKAYMMLFIEFYKSICASLNVMLTAETSTLLNQLLAASESEDKLEIIMSIILENRHGSYERNINNLISQIQAALRFVPNFFGLEDMPKLWSETIEKHRLFDQAMICRKLQDKLENKKHGLFWRMNYPFTPELASSTAHEILKQQENRHYEFTLTGLVPLDLKDKNGTIFRPKNSAKTYLLSQNELFVKENDEFKLVYTIKMGNYSVFIPVVLSKRIICYVPENYYKKIFLFVKEKRLVKDSDEVDLTRVELDVKAWNIVSCSLVLGRKIYLLSYQAEAYRVSIEHLQIECIDLSNGSKSVNCKLIPFKVEELEPNEEKLTQLKEISRNSHNISYMLRSTLSIVFLCYGVKKYPKDNLLTTCVLAYSCDPTSSELTFISRWSMATPTSTAVPTPLQLSALAFSRANMPYLLVQPMSPVFSLTLLCLQRSSLVTVQTISTKSQLYKRVCPEGSTLSAVSLANLHGKPHLVLQFSNSDTLIKYCRLKIL